MHSELISAQESLTKQVSHLSTRIAQMEELMEMQKDQQRIIINQNEEYVQQHKGVQDTIEKVKSIFRNEEGELITINLQTYLEQKIVEKIIGELKFNQVISTMENKFRESSIKFQMTTQSINEQHDTILLSLRNIEQEMKDNTNQVHQNSLFASQMDRILENASRTEKTQQEILDRLWKQEDWVQGFSEKISSKVDQAQMQDIQLQLKDNFVGAQYFNSQLSMLLGKVNSKTDSAYFEEKFGYIDKAVLQSSQKFEEQLQRDLKMYLSNILDQYQMKQDFERGMNDMRKETKVQFENTENLLTYKIDETNSLIGKGETRVNGLFKEIDNIKRELQITNETGKAKHEDQLQKFTSFDKKIFFLNEELNKKIELKPSHKDLRTLLQQVDQKLVDQQSIINQLQIGLESKTVEVEQGLQMLQEKLQGVVTSDDLNAKLEFIESLKNEALKIVADQDVFRKQFVKFEERLSVKISKFEIDQLKNQLSGEYVKKNVFDFTVDEISAKVKSNEQTVKAAKQETEFTMKTLKEEQQKLIVSAQNMAEKSEDKSLGLFKQIQVELNIMKQQLDMCKIIVQKSDESLLLKASKIDLNEIDSRLTDTYLDRDQLIKFIEEREEFNQMRNLETELKKFKNEQKVWKDSFNLRMSFSLDSKHGQIPAFDWIEELKQKVVELEMMKSSLAQKANHSDLIQLFSQKANKNVVNGMYNICSLLRKQHIYEIVSLQSFIKCISMKPDLSQAQQLQIQLNLKQLTKLIEWIAFSAEDQPIDTIKDHSKLEQNHPVFTKMEKLSESVVSKFKMFKVKKEEAGYKLSANENKMLDEYLSIISQESPFEMLTSPINKVDGARLIQTADPGQSPRLHLSGMLLPEQDPIIQSPARSDSNAGGASQYSSKLLLKSARITSSTKKRQNQQQSQTQDHLFPSRNMDSGSLTGQTNGGNMNKESQQIFTSPMLNSIIINEQNGINNNLSLLDKKTRSISLHTNNNQTWQSLNTDQDLGGGSDQRGVLLNEGYEVTDSNEFESNGLRSQQLNKFMSNSIKNIPSSVQSARGSVSNRYTNASNSQTTTMYHPLIQQQVNLSGLNGKQQNTGNAILNQVDPRSVQMSPLQQKRGIQTGVTPLVKRRTFPANATFNSKN